MFDLALRFCLWMIGLGFCVCVFGGERGHCLFVCLFVYKRPGFRISVGKEMWVLALPDDNNCWLLRNVLEESKLLVPEMLLSDCLHGQPCVTRRLDPGSII